MDRREELIQKLANEMDGYGYTQEQLEDMSNEEVFRTWLEWYGIVGYTEDITNAVEAISNVSLT